MSRTRRIRAGWSPATPRSTWSRSDPTSNLVSATSSSTRRARTSRASWSSTRGTSCPGCASGSGADLARAAVWVAVLIKDFDHAKQRLAPALGPEARHRLARQNADLALAAGRAGDHLLAVAGSTEAAELARLAGAEVVLEGRPAGQNAAGRRAVEQAEERGAGAVLLLSSDLPLVTRRAVRSMILTARRLGSPAVVAAPATG